MIISSSVHLQIVDADVISLLEKINNLKICMNNVEFTDELTAEFDVRKNDLNRLIQFLEKHHVKYTILTRNGVCFAVTRLFRRPVICVGILLIIILTFFLPGRILFVRVDGNDLVPDKEILEKASDCGITFGASISKLRSEQIKNALLEQIDSLQWAAVNTRGCIATIRVLEKKPLDILPVRKGEGSNIVATKDGLVLDVITTAGQAQCKKGQAVRAGQVLISGYVDCGKILKVCHAEGEVLAQTYHEIAVISPDADHYRGKMTDVTVRYSIRVGKKLIKLYGNCGISPTGCVKIYSEKEVKLPGDHTLPVTIVKETLLIHEERKQPLHSNHPHAWMQEIGREYVIDQMVAGVVKTEELCFTCSQFACKMEGSYLCEEMIGRSVYVKN